MTQTSAKPIYIGTMSGTSMDGLDIAAVTFDENDKPQLITSGYTGYPQDLKQALQKMALDSSASVTDMCQLDTRLGQFYAAQIKQFLEAQQISPERIAAIGSHGQTLRHQIQGQHPYTLQIGDPNIIAAQTGIDTVADFRRRDIALGGQGAPLATAFHHAVFRTDQLNRVIVNIGGIANITHLPADQELPVIGFDTGPGNTLMDFVCRHYLEQEYDAAGSLSKQGTVDHQLVKSMLADEPYFQQAIPKSTGTDYFSPQWLDQFNPQLAPLDLLASLTELTAISISQGIQALNASVDECYVCGGGSHNNYLMSRLQQHLHGIPVQSTAELGIDPDWVEAMAFAWLARRTLQRKPGNLPSVTKAENFTILGAVYYSHRQT